MIIVQDANILIDLYEVDLLKSFFALGHETHSTDLVLHEIDQPVHDYVTSGKIRQHILTPEQLEQVLQIQTSLGQGISLPDSSVLWLTSQLGTNVRLLTGDGKLRQCAEGIGIKVHGLLWILDQLVENKIVSAKEMIGKLEKLRNFGSRLPNDECQKRIVKWRAG